MNDTPTNDELSFFPDGYLARRAQARANRLCGSLLIVALLGVGGAYAIADRSLERLRGEHTQVSAAFDLEAARLGRLDSMQKEQQTLARRARLAESLVERTPRAEVLTELRDLLPEDASLVELVMASRVHPPTPKTPQQILAERQSPGMAVVEPKVYDVTLRVGGIAFTDVQVAQFISRLSRSRYFDDVNLLVSRDMDVAGQSMRRFDVELIVRAEPLPPQTTIEPLATTETP